MKKLGTFILAVVIFGACESRRNVEEDQTDTTTTAAPVTPKENQLTEAQKADGWKLLFNGENMDGWKTYQNKENDSWEVVDGTLHCKPDTLAKKRADILTVDQYANFELA